ncbi:MAG: hypothetical protein IPP13_12145 [Kouleothrix sp.]|nr:hypothetical protein [Kouleothrix sp.]
MGEITPQPAHAPTNLLRTRLEPPHPPTPVVLRPALLACIDTGLARKLTLLAAPAGFGKTTLLATWAAAAPCPVAWVTCDAGDNDPVRFWSSVLSTCQAWDAAIGKAGLATLRLAQQPEPGAVLTAFINELAQLPGQRALVLDDYHTISDSALHAQVALLIEHAPRTLHIILATRTIPELPLARWRVRNELTELGADELRFSTDEVCTFLTQTLAVMPAPELVAQVAQQTDGWVAGLRLVALAAGQRGAPALASFSGRHPHVVAYLVSEVLDAQAEPLRTFLLLTSALARLNAGLCDAVTGRSDSAQLLDQLVHTNLFLLPLGATEHGWYRYYPLFAEALQQYARQQLDSAALQTLHTHACAWYEAHGLLPEAVDAALAAAAWERAATLIEALVARDGFNQAHTLRRWVEQMPAAAVQSRPLLCFGYAVALLFTSDRYAPATAAVVERWVQLAEAHWQVERNTPRLGQVAALRAMVAFWQDDLPRTFAYTQQARALLDTHDVLYQGICRLYAGIEALLDGKVADAKDLALEARALCAISQNTQGVLASMYVLASACMQQGNLDQAAALWQEWLDAAVGDMDMLDDQSEALLGLAMVAYERNQLDLAAQQAARAFALAQQRRAERVRVQATLLLARIQHARGHTPQAQQQAQALATQTQVPLLLRDIAAVQAQLALAADDLDAVQYWHAALAAQRKPAAPIQQEQEALIVAQLHGALGEHSAALQLLEPWYTDAVAHGRTRSEIAILLIQAQAYAAQGEAAPAARALARALLLGQPRGLARLFLDNGAPLGALLQAVAPTLSRRLAAYAAGLLQTLTPAHAADAAQRVLRLEPLSAQELRVLRLLVAGRSNAEIAHDLIISTNTVKTHIKSIYRKLDVNSRAAARAAARELDLLKPHR